jgi:hypothetical protein
MLGPAIEALGYVAFATALAFGLVNALYGTAFFLVAFFLGAVLSVAAVALEEQTFRRYPRTRDLARLMALSFVEVFGYRQLNAWWRMKALWLALRGTQHGWGEMKRRGFAAEAA